MPKIRKLSLLLAVALCLLTALPVSGAQTGSLLIQKITAPTALYRVADAQGVLEEPFLAALTGELTEQTADAAQAKQLQQYVKEKAISGQEEMPDGKGEVFYPGLAEGYYLVCSLAEKGEFAPFLLRIPLQAGDKIIYDVQAEPKSGPSADPDNPSSLPPLQPQIPQTGFIQWPKYLLLALGVVCIAAGLAEIFRGREKQYE